MIENTTIIIPTRNIDYLLKECLSNIRKLYAFVKIIVIADEYNENEIKDFDENIIFLKSVNKNMSSKRNLGVNSAYTEYIAFIDSDAYPNNNWIEIGTDYLAKNTDYVAVTGNQLIPKDDNIEKQCIRQVRFCRLFTYSKWSKIIDLNAKEQDCAEFITSNVIIRKCTYIQNGGMNENIYLAEDNEFSQRLHSLGLKFRFIPNVQVFHHEATYLPFMKKIFSMAFYYSVTPMQNISANNIKEKVRMYIPLLGSIFLILLFVLSIKLGLNILINAVIPLIIFFIFSIEAVKLSDKISQNKIKSYLYFMFLFVSFCIFYISGQIAGLLNIKSIKAENLYKHY